MDDNKQQEKINQIGAKVEKGEVNLIELLLEMNQMLARLDEKVTLMKDTGNKADKALNLSVENSHQIKEKYENITSQFSNLTKLVYTLYGILGGTIGLTLLVYIVEKFL